MKKYLLFIFPALFTFCTAFSQTKTISGKVTDASNDAALPGVTVKVKGTAVGTITQADGTYSLEAPADAAQLVFSYIGYDNKEAAISGNTVNVSLSSGNKLLNEVVVVGYGTKLKEDLTGSVNKVNNKEFEHLPLPSFESALQGRASGVFINSNSGKLGEPLDIKIRGISSVSASSSPLIVIDGVPIVSRSLGSDINKDPDNPLAALNPDDIASIDVLKDASAAAIYGSRASNGVIIITTKSGKPGKTKVDVGFYTGISHPAHKRKFLNAAEYKELFDSAFMNSSYNGVYWNKNDASDAWYEFTGTHDWDSSFNTDWADKAFQTGRVTQYHLTVSGGDQKTTFLLGGTYNTQRGILYGDKLSRGTGRINIEHSIYNNLKIGLNVTALKSVDHREPNDNDFANPIQLNALPPIQPEFDPETGDYYRQTVYYNNLIDRTHAYDISTTLRSIGNVYGSWDILNSLNFRSEAGFDVIDLEEEEWKGKNTQDGAQYNGYTRDTYTRSLNYNLNNYFTYHQLFNQLHDLKVVAGMSFTDGKNREASATGGGFASDDFKKVSNAAKILAGVSTATEYNILSYFARAGYKYNDKYLLEVSARVDGSSRFSKKYRYGLFPAVSAGWIISKEDFLMNSRIISFLKPRASYGLTGNAEIGNFSFRNLWGSAFFGDEGGIIPTQLGNDSLKWESTKQLDLGLDFGFFNNRISGTVDYYDKRTNDLLLSFALPAQSGFTSILRNVGDMENKGWEFSLETENLVGRLRWSSSFNISFNQNKVTNLGGVAIPQIDGAVGRVAEGEPFGYFYGYKYAGADPQNGDALYYNAKGEKVNFDNFDNYKQKLGNPNPKFYGGFGNTLSYKGFDLDIQTQFVYGNDIFNVSGVYQSVQGDYFDNQTRDQLNFWRKPGDITNVPQPRFLDGNGTATSSRWIEDGSYFRLKSVRLGYNLPLSFISRYGLSNLRIYVTGENLLTITNYSGYDPEVNSFGNFLATFTLGHDYYTTPQARTISAGIDLSF